MELDKSPRNNLPQGFSQNIESSGMPVFSNEGETKLNSKPGAEKTTSNKMDMPKIIAMSAAIFVIFIIAIIIIVQIVKNMKSQSLTVQDMLSAYVSILDGEDTKTFKPYIYKKVANKEDVEAFLQSSKELFSDKKVFSENVTFKTTELTNTADVEAVLGNKAQNATKVDFELKFSTNPKATVPDSIITFSFYGAYIKNSFYFAYGSSKGTKDIENYTDDDLQEPEPADESVASDNDAEDATEKAVEETETSEEVSEKTEEEVTEEKKTEYVTVGNDDVGTIGVPGDFVLSDFDLSSVNKIDTKYAYKSPDGSATVILIKYANAAKDMEKRFNMLMSHILPSYTISLPETVDRIDGMYYASGKSGKSKVEAYLGNAESDGKSRALVIIADSQSTIFEQWRTYSLSKGVKKSNDIYSDLSENMTVVGNDELGRIAVANEFKEDVNYDYDNSKGWSKGDEKIILVSYRGTAQESLPLTEFASIMRENFLGDKNIKAETGDWFPGAIYSKRVDEEQVTEIYCFKGNDTVNRLILIYSPKENSVVSTYYKKYSIPCGVKKDID